MSTATAGEWEVDNDEYHADAQSVSHSMLEVYRDSPVSYAAQFVYRTMKRPPATPAMCLGTALHALVLETERFDELVIVAPRVDRRTKDGKARWEEFELECDGRTVITDDQNETINKMAKSVLAHPEAAKLIKRAEYREQAFRWVNEPTGILCKCKPDLLWWAGSIIGDIKTAADPTPGAWSRQAASMGYARQNALYRTGIETISGRQPQFLHIVVGSSEPYETCAYFMNPEDVKHSEFQNQKTLNDVAESIKSGIWTGPQNRAIKTISMPRWFLND